MALDVAGPPAAGVPPASGLDGRPRLGHLAEVARRVERTHAPLFVRVSGGPGVDRCTVSRDRASGCVLPGVSVDALDPEPWWDRPVEQWVARQVCRRTAPAAGDGHRSWLFTGEVSGRGPDCEPLLVAVHPVAVLDGAVLAEARALCDRVFEAGRD
jgi:hypothetical protein